MLIYIKKINYTLISLMVEQDTSNIRIQVQVLDKNSYVGFSFGVIKFIITLVIRWKYIIMGNLYRYNLSSV